MKKIFSKEIFILPILLLTLFVSVNKVNAEVLPSYNWSNAFTSIRTLQQQYDYFNSIPTIINNLKSYYNSNLSSSYQYYYIVGSPTFQAVSSYACLYASNSNGVGGATVYDSSFRFQYYYDVSYCYITYPNVEYRYSDQSGVLSNSHDFGSAYVYEFNLPFYYDHTLGSGFSDDTTYQSYEEIIFPSYSSTDFDISTFSIFDNNPIPSVKSLYDGTYNSSDVIGYVSINLNNYAYVALSLKDYNFSNSFNTNMSVKGQLCLTPVYDYGMSNKSSYYPGYQVDRCSPIYSDFTTVPVTILDSDIQNHSIYYLKAFNTSIDNIVKVDPNVFNISYITNENANNPYVNVNGRQYPTIPYDNLTTNATKSESEGYISGSSENLFDITSDSSFIENLFLHPFDTLKSFWSIIVTFFAIISGFISLLPSTLQSFLLVAFAFSLILGLIRYFTL